MSEVSTKPYLIRAIHEWCVDQGLTPYLAVAVDGRTMVPRSFVQDGQIVLNIGPDATQSLVMGNELIAFQARFGGVAQNISVPVDNVSAIYARENGHGMAFELASGSEHEAGEEAAEFAADAADDGADASWVPASSAEPAKAGLRSHLKLVK
ncbi:ClpXP protease specificity-enhancing factor [Zoogloea sp.]|uniref:ClpXP protease specificity-enhancing factor n=1 Tax=Zoogloea sp. TaxID=49181 RepID=UPI002600E675|nr:ClpXP protease specificity-enhancing factor [Zoogloea sp.]MCK6394424.1 ClpXP protease specificity-enhancing factor [Zoogloea sp.]